MLKHSLDPICVHTKFESFTSKSLLLCCKHRMRRSFKLPSDLSMITLRCAPIFDLVDVHRKPRNGEMHAVKVTRWKTAPRNKMVYAVSHIIRKGFFFQELACSLGWIGRILLLLLCQLVLPTNSFPHLPISICWIAIRNRGFGTARLTRPFSRHGRTRTLFRFQEWLNIDQHLGISYFRFWWQLISENL